MLKRFVAKFFLLTVPIGVVLVLLVEFGKDLLLAQGIQVHPLIPLVLVILALIVLGRLTVGAELDALNAQGGEKKKQEKESN